VVVAGHSTALLAGIALNAGFVVVEMVAGWRAGSMALISDAAHNLSDVLALVLAWAGLWLADRAPTPRFTWGWQRAAVSAGLFNAAALVLLGLLLAWGAIGRLRMPTPIDAPMVMAVAAIGILINSATAWMLMRAGGDDLNMRGAFLHMVADAAVSAGVVLAAAATAFSGALWIDAAVSLVISALITLGAWPVFKQALSLFMDGVPAGIDLSRVRSYLLALPGVGNVHDLHVWPLGTREAALSAHLVMTQGVADDDFLLRARSGLQDTFGIGHTTLQMETEQVAQRCTQDCGRP
jgi:cobalt-zinc-cadmium efflux system protein